MLKENIINELITALELSRKMYEELRDKESHEFEINHLSTWYQIHKTIYQAKGVK